MKEKGVIAPNVKKGILNVALDDNRKWRGTPFTFNAILMGNEDKVVETWFAGEHGNVGGSYYTKGMPDQSLEYMMEWMEKGLEEGNNFKFMKAKDIKPENTAHMNNHEEIHINPEDLTVAPDHSDKIHIVDKQISRPTHRPVYAVMNNKIMIKGATIKIHESILKHMEVTLKEGKKYPIHPNLKRANFVLVGSLGKKVKVETKKLSIKLENDYP